MSELAKGTSNALEVDLAARATMSRTSTTTTTTTAAASGAASGTASGMATDTTATTDSGAAGAGAASARGGLADTTVEPGLGRQTTSATLRAQSRKSVIDSLSGSDGRASVDPNLYTGLGADNAPTMLYGKLECVVCVGPLRPKSPTDSSLHVTYQTTMTSLVQTPAAAQLSSSPSSSGAGGTRGGVGAVAAGEDGTAHVIVVVKPFAEYRDLQKKLSKHDELIKGKFPPTLSKSSLGIQLTRDEVQDR